MQYYIEAENKLIPAYELSAELAKLGYAGTPQVNLPELGIYIVRNVYPKIDSVDCVNDGSFDESKLVAKSLTKDEERRCYVQTFEFKPEKSADSDDDDDDDGEDSIDSLNMVELKLELAENIRQVRNNKLTATDYLLMNDYPLDDSKKELVTAYRQALRDIIKQEGFPFNIEWPELKL